MSDAANDFFQLGTGGIPRELRLGEGLFLTQGKTRRDETSHTLKRHQY